MSGDTFSLSDLAHKFVDAMFRHDSKGRLVGTEDGQLEGVPRLYILRTKDQVICRFRTDLSNALVSRLEELIFQDRGKPRTWPAQNAEYIRLLSLDGPISALQTELVYVALEQREPRTPVVAIRTDNAELLRANFDDWLAGVSRAQPFMAVIKNDEAVSLCASVRASASVHCAGVETHPTQRRQGYASDAVAGWTSAVRSLGAVPFYSAQYDNLPSQRTARSAGLTLVGADMAVT